MNQVVLGTRGSELALRQTEQVKNSIEKQCPELQVEMRVIKTTGDKMKEASLTSFAGKGLFVKEIEEALQRGDIDIAVHSLKDLPTELPRGLVLGAVTGREDPREAWVSVTGHTLKSLPKNGRVGTSSLRRTAQLNRCRPDLKIEPIRGNIHTRLRKATDFGAIVIALAGLKRLGLEDSVTGVLDPEDCLPAAGQGALGLEIREDNSKAAEIVQRLHHRETGYAVMAERAFLWKLEGGCQVPVGALAQLEPGGGLVLTGMAAEISGFPFYREKISGSLEEAELLGEKLAEKLLAQGAGETLEEIRRREENSNE